MLMFTSTCSTKLISDVRFSENSLAVPVEVTSHDPLDEAEPENIGGSAVQL